MLSGSVRDSYRVEHGARCVQELGRFPDLGSFDMESVSAYGGPNQAPSSSERQADGSMHSGESNRQASSRSEMTPFVTQPKKTSKTAADEITEETDTPADEDEEASAAEDDTAQDGEEEEAEPAADEGKFEQSNDDNIAHLSDAGSDDGAAAAGGQLGASSAMIRGGESLISTVAPGSHTCT